MSYLAEAEPDSALTPEAGGGLHLSHCARTAGGARTAAITGAGAVPSGLIAH